MQRKIKSYNKYPKKKKIINNRTIIVYRRVCVLEREMYLIEIKYKARGAA